MAIKPLELNHIAITGSFWQHYMTLIRTKVIPYQWAALNNQLADTEPSSCIQNFQVAAKKIEGKHEGCVFQDSDIMKWLEAVSFSLVWHPDKVLEALADSAIDIICDTQQPDGYLNTYYIINGLDKRFTNLRDHHELYCLGHMLEAAIAYAKATQKTKLLEAAIQYVELVLRTFGTQAHQIPGYPGHEILELALTMLYEYTNNSRYLELAEYFIFERGKTPLFFEEETKKYHNANYWADTYMKLQYYQAGKPILEQAVAEGHAVRAVYLYAGMAALSYHTGNSFLLEQCKCLFNNIANKQMYITGGIGASSHGESFTFDYDLPNDTIYSETCAAIGLIFFAKQLLRNEINGQYADVMERALYNTVISGMGLDGQSFFYVNPLEVTPESSLKDIGKQHVKVSRQRWFGCACCPPNIARLISSLGTYAYAISHDTIFFHLYIDSRLEAPLSSGILPLQVTTKYPWGEIIQITCENDTPLTATLVLRIPSWCTNFTLKLNNDLLTPSPQNGYIYLTHTWQPGDTIMLTLSMPVQLSSSHFAIRENIGKVCISRGPIVYCLEEVDNGKNLHRLYLSQDTSFNLTSLTAPLEHVVAIEAMGSYLDTDSLPNYSPSSVNDTLPLYSTYVPPIYTPRKLTFIPYFTWANRTPGEMLVWVHMSN